MYEPKPCLPSDLVDSLGTAMLSQTNFFVVLLADGDIMAQNDPLSVNAVMSAAKNTRRPATAIGGSAAHQQNLAVKQQLHNQTVQLRGAFLRQDGRITGTIPKYMLSSCLRAGGLELDAQQTSEACWKFMTGDGRFNWILFCEHIEKAR